MTDEALSAVRADEPRGVSISACILWPSRFVAEFVWVAVCRAFPGRQRQCFYCWLTEWIVGR